MKDKDFNYTAQGDIQFGGIRWKVTIWAVNNIALKKRLEKVVGLAEKQKPTAPNKVGGYTCRICGAPAEYKEGVSKTGKPWKAYFCSTGEKSHVKWL